MRKNENGKEIITHIIQNVLENRKDIALSETFIHEVASNTIKTTPASEIMSEMRAIRFTAGSSKDSLQLAKSIELLAIVMHMIDFQFSKYMH